MRTLRSRRRVSPTLRANFGARFVMVACSVTGVGDVVGVGGVIFFGVGDGVVGVAAAAFFGGGDALAVIGVGVVFVAFFVGGGELDSFSQQLKPSSSGSSILTTPSGLILLL